MFLKNLKLVKNTSIELLMEKIKLQRKLKLEDRD